LERNTINRIIKEATITTTAKKRNPNVFAVRAALNPIATSKEKTTPYKIDLINGASGNKSTLITGTSHMGNRIVNTTKRHLLSHHIVNRFLLPL